MFIKCVAEKQFSEFFLYYFIYLNSAIHTLFKLAVQLLKVKSVISNKKC